jgi:hypothetical protein
MFALGAVIGMQAALAQIEAERQYEAHVMARIGELPIEQRHDAVVAFLQAKEKARLEAIEERRHREICAAIRSTRPTGFGVFW